MRVIYSVIIKKSASRKDLSTSELARVGTC